MEENISQNAGKILIQIYLIYKQKNEVPNIEQLLKTTGLPEDALKRGLKYCYEKDFIDLKIIETIGTTKMFGPFLIKDITAQGIDIIENPENEKRKKPFNLTFNFNTKFNIESFIKGEAKLF